MLNKNVNQTHNGNGNMNIDMSTHNNLTINNGTPSTSDDSAAAIGVGVFILTALIAFISNYQTFIQYYKEYDLYVYGIVAIILLFSIFYTVNNSENNDRIKNTIAVLLYSIIPTGLNNVILNMKFPVEVINYANNLKLENITTNTEYGNIAFIIIHFITLFFTLISPLIVAFNLVKNKSTRNISAIIISVLTLIFIFFGNMLVLWK
ncbi:hypothetical protein [Lactococcus garvieae]|nr:hypothetical protein [Lactococcus garvieae]